MTRVADFTDAFVNRMCHVLHKLSIKASGCMLRKNSCFNGLLSLLYSSRGVETVQMKVGAVIEIKMYDALNFCMLKKLNKS